jgi:hypothetical protein
VQETKRMDQLAPLTPEQVKRIVGLPLDVASSLAELPELEKKADQLRKLIEKMPDAQAYSDRLAALEAKMRDLRAYEATDQLLQKQADAVLALLSDPSFTEFVEEMNEGQLVRPLLKRLAAPVIEVMISVVDSFGQNYSLQPVKFCIGQSVCELGIDASATQKWIPNAFIQFTYRCGSSKVITKKIVAGQKPPYVLSCTDL